MNARYPLDLSAGATSPLLFVSGFAGRRVSFEVAVTALPSPSFSPGEAQTQPSAAPSPTLLYSKLASSGGKYPSEQTVVDAVDRFLKRQSGECANEGAAAGTKSAATADGPGGAAPTVQTASPPAKATPAACCCVQ